MGDYGYNNPQHSGYGGNYGGPPVDPTRGHSNYDSNYNPRGGHNAGFRGGRGGGRGRPSHQSGAPYDQGRPQRGSFRGGYEPRGGYDSGRGYMDQGMQGGHQGWGNNDSYPPYDDHNQNPYGHNQYEVPMHQSPRGGYEPNYSQSGGFGQNFSQGGPRKSTTRPPDPAPNTSVMFRGLNPNTTEETLMEHVKPFGQVISVKLILDRNTGRSRGIAFAEFANLADSKAFYEHHRQHDNINSHKISIDGTNVDLKYSRPQSNQPAAPLSDWTCPHCNINNFAKRTECFQCAAPRPALPGGNDQTPVATLSILNLNLNTPKQTLINLFQTYSPVKSCRLLWDKSRNISRGTAFIEFYSVEEANSVLNQTQNLVIDGSQVRVSFARHNNSDAMTPGSFGPESQGGHSQPQSSYTPQGGKPSYHNEPPQSHHQHPSGGPSQSSYPPSGGQSSSQYYPSQSSNQPAAAAQIDPQQSVPPSQVPPQAGIADPLIGVPDAQDYDFDESSGFFFNPKINYYFDPKTKFFYDLNEKQFYYYDHSKQQFVKHEVSTEPESIDQSQQLQQTSSTDDQTQQTDFNSPQQTTVGTSSQPSQGELSAAPQGSGELPPQPIGAVEGGVLGPNVSTETIRAYLEQSTGVICTLCKRKFPNNEGLLKHNQLSTLHKTTLEKAIADHLEQYQLASDPSLQSTVGSNPSLNQPTNPEPESGSNESTENPTVNDQEQDYVHVSGKSIRDPENSEENAAKRQKLE